MNWSFCGCLAVIFSIGYLDSASFAHPVPKMEFDRLVTVDIRPQAIFVDYVLEIDEFTLLASVADPDLNITLKSTGTLTRQDIANAFLKWLQANIPNHLLASWNANPLRYRPLSGEVTFGDSVKFSVRCMATTIPLPFPNHLSMNDQNFLNKSGKLTIRFDVQAPLIVDSIQDISEARREGTGLEKNLVNATIRYPVEFATPIVRRPQAESPITNDPEQNRLRAVIKQVWEENSLAPLLDDQIGFWTVLLIAFFHGAIHSVAPGHGKTMITAYLVGERGTKKHALLLAVVVTVTHTITALLVAISLKWFFPNVAPKFVQGLLGFFGGLIIGMIGIWLLVTRLSNHEGHVHSHGAGHSHGPTPEEFARVQPFRLILMGISSGMIPCWGAILWVLYCVTANRLGFAIWTLLAFSLGLATILTMLGIAVSYGSRLSMKTQRFSKFAHWLPVLGAGFVAAIGFWICRGHLNLLIPGG